VAIADQMTKIWAVAHLASGETIQVIGQYAQLRLVYNRGGALGTDMGGGLFYLITSLIILYFVFYFIFINRHFRLIAWPLAGIAGGAIGNIIDRVRLGKVVDFIDLDFIDFSFFGRQIERWWVFNIADAAITIGVGVMLIYVIFFSKREMFSNMKKKADNGPDADSVNNVPAKD
jgi:signal peptidase II